MNLRPGSLPSSRRRYPRLEQLEDRLVLHCVSTDPFICTPLPSGHNGLAMHIHPKLTIVANGQRQEIPANIGILDDGQMLPLHTHDASGTIHVESPTQREFRLKNFFEVWDQPLSPTQIMGFSGTVTMIVDSRPSTEFGELVLKDNQNIIFAVQASATPKPGTLQFSAAAYSVAADAGSATITVNRTSGTDGAIQVNYATADGTGRAGVDYVAASGVLSFASGETSKSFTVSILNSGAADNKTVNLTLSSATGGATLGTPVTAALTITAVRPPIDPVVNRNYVAQVYRDFYEREADQAGLSTWAGALDQGVSSTQVLLELASTQEYYAQMVRDMYEQYLGRSADATGLAAFTSYLSAGGTLEAVRAVMCGSDEYFQKYGASNTGYLENVFRHLLDREIDTGARSGFNAALAQGSTTRTDVVFTICASSEYRERFARELYQEYLGRIPDPGGLSYWINEALGRGVREEHVRVGFLTSNEYYQHYARPS